MMKAKIERYNWLTERWNKACEWIEAPERTDEEIEKWMPEFEKILEGLKVLYFELSEKGYKLKPGELLKI